MRRILVISLLLSVCIPAWSQKKPADIRVRLAQGYERSGDFAAALRVYDELFESDSSNLMLIESLKRCHLQLKQHEEVVALINHSLTLNPADVGALAQLGSIYILMADEKKAYEAWDRAIAVDPANETTYRVVASAMTQSRLFAKAIETYRLARRRLDKPGLFTSDIAYLYGVMLKYRESTGEYLSLLRQTPSQLNYIQSRIAGFISRDEGLRVSTEVVKEAVREEGNNVEFRRLLAWLQMEARDFPGAYETYDGIDKLTGAEGRELFGFAERAFREKSYPSAARAYGDVIGRYPGFRFMPNARFGLARALEELDSSAVPGSDSDIPPYAKPLEAYRKIVEEYQGSEYAGRSLLQIARIRYHKLNDPEGAAGYLEKIVAEYGMFVPVATEARLLLGDVWTATNEREKAAGILRDLAGSAPFTSPDRERAALGLAKLYFYEGRYDESLNLFSGILQNPSSDAANDAITLQLLISENRKNNEAILKQYGEAELFRIQKKPEKALGVLDELLSPGGSAGMLDICAFRKGEILADLGRPDEAIASFNGLLRTFPESLLRERALFNIGQIYETAMKDSAKAIESYQLILEKYPNSLQANEARNRIRMLRGDNI